MNNDYEFKDKYVKTAFKAYESVIKESIVIYLFLVLPYFTYNAYDHIGLYAWDSLIGFYTWDAFTHWLIIAPILGVAFCMCYTKVRGKIKLYFTLRKEVMRD